MNESVFDTKYETIRHVVMYNHQEITVKKYVKTWDRSLKTLKKLNRHQAKWMKEMSNTIFAMANKRYYLSVVEIPDRRESKHASGDQHIHEKYKRIKTNILQGNDFSIDDVIEMMEEGVL